MLIMQTLVIFTRHDGNELNIEYQITSGWNIALERFFRRREAPSRMPIAKIGWDHEPPPVAGAHKLHKRTESGDDGAHREGRRLCAIICRCTEDAAIRQTPDVADRHIIRTQRTRTIGWA